MSEEEKIGTASEFLDTSILLDYLILGRFAELIEEKLTPNISSISIFEVKKKLLKGENLSISQINNIVASLKKQVMIIDVDAKIAEMAADISEESGLGAADAIIYASARIINSELVTLDNDFRGLKGARVL